ncbi:hypothetical protein PG993_003056 [Apiospora rasikravindrae]|uniref:DUF7580 domain-containing protein n=1 Tax=Apiospora rasikravindrae TaxID=990691 RepID=A0ABR1TYF3_9PEZI
MAELALAILPLCIGTIKGIAVARKRLKVLKHHDSEAKRLQKKFRSQSTVFLDEMQLLLQDVVGRDQAQALIEDTTDTRWSSEELQGQLKEYLGRRYEDFQEAVAEVRDCTTALNEKLNTGMEDATSPEVKIKASERMQQAVHVMMKKSSYQNILGELREATEELKRLRKAAAKIQQCPPKSHRKRVRPLPESFQQVAQHSRSFYDALRSFWSCFQAKHTSHDLRLLLDSRKDGTLRVIVRYRTQNGFETKDGLLDLFVRSQSLRLAHITMPSMNTTAADCSGGEERPSKARRVRFPDDCVSSIAVMNKLGDALAPRPTDNMSPKPLNLCSSGDICTQLCTQTSRCGGYFDTPEHLRHHLYPVCDESCDHTQCFNPKRLGEPSLLDEIFKHPVERAISVPSQLRLALSLVKGVLQFQSTPWLQPLWRLQDLSFFQVNESLAASLATVHIGTELTKGKQRDTVMANGSEDLGNAQLVHGIRNLTMHSLGVALLQIGQWDALKPDDIAEVRRIADLSFHDSRLGPRFQRITQQCLDCDFGFGKDLSQPELQGAIYRDVVRGQAEELYFSVKVDNLGLFSSI